MGTVWREMRIGTKVYFEIFQWWVRMFFIWFYLPFFRNKILDLIKNNLVFLAFFIHWSIVSIEFSQENLTEKFWQIIIFVQSNLFLFEDIFAEFVMNNWCWLSGIFVEMGFLIRNVTLLIMVIIIVTDPKKGLDFVERWSKHWVIVEMIWMVVWGLGSLNLENIRGHE